MNILSKLTGRRKAAEQTAEEQYRELVEREAGGKLRDDDNTVAHVEDVLSDTGRTLEDFQADVDRLREEQALEREVSKEPKLRKAFATVRAEHAQAQAAFDAVRVAWERDQSRLNASVAQFQNELSAIGTARDRLRSEFPDSAVAKQAEAVKVRGELEGKLTGLAHEEKTLAREIADDEQQLQSYDGSSDTSGREGVAVRLAENRRRHRKAAEASKAARGELAKVGA